MPLGYGAWLAYDAAIAAAILGALVAVAILERRDRRRSDAESPSRRGRARRRRW